MREVTFTELQCPHRRAAPALIPLPPTSPVRKVEPTGMRVAAVEPWGWLLVFP